MKKFTATLLISLFILNIFGYGLLFEVRLLACKMDGLKKVENADGVHDLTVIFIPNNELKNLLRTGKNEIKYNYRMYDVVKEENSKIGIYFYCFDDKNEDAVLKYYAGLQKAEHSKQNAEGNESADFVFNNIIKTFLAPFKIINNNITGVQSYLILKDKKYLSPTIEIQSPPPEKSSLV